MTVGLHPLSSFVGILRLRLSYPELTYLYKHYTLELNGGVKNVLNQFQRDLDKGMNRDAAFIYGPALPRTWFLGLILKL